ncbi:hypothetical protein V1512DRAFT_250300 [Lipomyces arxii]|uniref:uncharacterized protein n=1 Tax=Lipomyces arxii TaxID=56418 RepID=UPI0034CF5784
MLASKLSRVGVEEAYVLIHNKVKKTPVLTCESISRMVTDSDSVSSTLFFKCENFQKGGAFKFRVSDAEQGSLVDANVEPSSAVPLAVVMSDRWRSIGVKGNIGLIVSGGNIDMNLIGPLLSSAC